MKVKNLNNKNFLIQVSRYGFFAEQFPECFSSEKFSNAVEQLSIEVEASKKQASYGKKNTTSPSTLSTYKNDISRRVLSVPNPEAFLRLAKFMQQKWDKIEIYTKSNCYMRISTQEHRRLLHIGT